MGPARTTGSVFISARTTGSVTTGPTTSWLCIYFSLRFLSSGPRNKSGSAQYQKKKSGSASRYKLITATTQDRKWKLQQNLIIYLWYFLSFALKGGDKNAFWIFQPHKVTTTDETWDVSEGGPAKLISAYSWWVCMYIYTYIYIYISAKMSLILEMKWLWDTSTKILGVRRPNEFENSWKKW